MRACTTRATNLHFWRKMSSMNCKLKVLDPEVAVNKEEYQVFEELGRGRFGTVFHCFQHRGLRLHQNGGLGGWWRGGGGCRQGGDRKEVAAGEEVIVIVVGEEVAECVDLVKKKEMDGLRTKMPVALAECVEIAKLFPNLFGQPSAALVLSDSHVPPVNQKLKISVVLSGGQAPGGHNVISGIFDLAEGSTLYGFRGGPAGIKKCKYVELTSDYIYPYRNQGGFDMIRSGRDKIETPEQFKQAEETVQKLDLEGLVVIGGDDSNTNACLLAEHFNFGIILFL
ncbi:hypothetical protein JHK84_034001 [Glycine max]|nr:hypothetical protein JHK85_034378 [Glycine max]KAG4986047.1 hypothetical protein JHK86_033738 [Glycine max]KAG5140233.1 hypothetical protein JHK84_034001 [Glycine max]